MTASVRGEMTCMGRIEALVLETDYPMDFLCYAPEEFEKLKRVDSIVSKALEEGVVV